MGPPPSILHLDMDAFYAAVEIRCDPSLSGKPVVVGGTGARGVVASCSYEARAYGVHSAMPAARARRLCPHAVFLPGRHHLYQEYSERLHRVLRSFTPLVEGVALDEAFLDVSGARRLLGTGPEIAPRLRQRVYDELGLWASVGVARTKLLAKLGSEAAKPRASLTGMAPGLGVKVVWPAEELSFLHPLPARALWGVGPATMRRLERFGVRTVGDVAALPEETLVGALGPALGHQLHELAWGRDGRAVVPDRAPKSVGHEETYARDHHRHEPLRREAVRLADAVGARLRRQGLAGRTVVVKVRFADFRTITRSRTVPSPLDAGPELARVAIELLDGVDVSGGVRLLGVTASGLVEREARQLNLDGSGADATGVTPEGRAGWDEASRAVDRVRGRFGDGAVGPAALLDRSGIRLRRQGDQQWGPDAAR